MAEAKEAVPDLVELSIPRHMLDSLNVASDTAQIQQAVAKGGKLYNMSLVPYLQYLGNQAYIPGVLNVRPFALGCSAKKVVVNRDSPLIPFLVEFMGITQVPGLALTRLSAGA